jgi:hypothetical protein
VNQAFTLTGTIEVREQKDPFIYLYQRTDGKLYFDAEIDQKVVLFIINSF